MPTALDLSPPVRLDWRQAPTPPPLAGHGLHLWRLPRPDASQDEQALAVLSVPERTRAQTIRSPAAHRSFIHARADMRRILAAYLDLLPGQLTLDAGSKGKPHITAPETDLRFNLSHSGNLAMLTVLRGREVGLDLEQVRPRRGLEAIANRMFDRHAATALRELPENERLHRFHLQWTQLEAGVKALGSGLFDPQQRNAGDMAYAHFIPQPGYLACLALLGDMPGTGDWLSLECPVRD